LAYDLFEGYIVSDQGALENVVKAHHYSKDYVHAAADIANAGTCLEDGNAMDKSGNVFSNLDDAVNQNLVTMDTLKDAVSRLFLVRMKLGEFDPPDMNPYTSLSMSLIQSDKHQQIALQAAMKTIVLLKNDGKLPLGSIDKACAIGPFIDDTELLFGDYSPNDADNYSITPYVGIMNYTSIGKVTLNKAVGCSDGPTCTKYSSSDIKTACSGMDIVIATAGNSKDLESEGNDRADIEFPGNQLQLLKDAEMASGNAPIILILFNANPLDISYAKTNDRFSAILEAYYPGQTAGEAIANVLTGKYNPAGRLPNTWPMSLDQVPDMTNYTMEGRTYRYSTAEPLYPFGYGLSYTTFKYTDINVSPDTAKAGTNITVSFTVTNTGKMDGDEVSQVYIEWIDTTDPVPIKQLVGVSRNFIKQNENKQLSFTITGDQMKIWVDNWVIPTGQYGVSAGGQQPGQQTTVPSNILTGAFKII
jgi:beta-glucosidase